MTRRPTGKAARVAANVKKMNQFITSNKREFFKQGKVIPEETLASWFDIDIPSATASRQVRGQYTFKMLTAYTNLNKVLVERGLYIKSTNYGEEYHVLELEDNANKAKEFDNVGKAKVKFAEDLAANSVTYRAKWTKLNADQQQTVVDRLKNTFTADFRG